MSGDPFWTMILKGRWLWLSGAMLLFILRLVQFNMSAPIYLLCWNRTAGLFPFLRLVINT